MILLDNSIIFTAIPKIQAAMHPAGWWLITARDVQRAGAAIVAPASLSRPHAAVLTAHVQAALTAGSRLLTACLLVVLGLITGMAGGSTFMNASQSTCIISHGGEIDHASRNLHWTQGHRAG